ncbi:MAG: oligosaccharide flippase family protein [Bacilli bacterium]|nr:oligosaccharide flippase family protein [Bacilli bacterium]
MSSIKKNFIYNVLYQILIILIPIITVPYVSRILGADQIGIYSYTYSIVYYFMLISLLGINNYGNRTIAKSRDNKHELSKSFFSIYIIQIIMSILMLILYLLYVLLFENSYKHIALIQSIYIFSCIFDINWLFFGLEKFKITVTRSSLLKIISLILIFIFVKNSNDLSKYTLILAISTLLSQLLLLPFLKKEVNYTKISFNDIKQHIKPCLKLFIPVIAVSIYKIMDKIMLGVMCDISEVGYYEQAEKIISIPIGLITALGTVMLPRISNLIAKKDDIKVKEYINKSISFMMFLAFPIFFGLVGVSEDFIPIFLGSGFIKSSILIYYLASTVLFISFANIIRTEYLIPKEKDNIYIISVILGAIINLIINYLLIPKYQSIGACIGTIFAEFSVMFYQLISIRKELPIINYIKNIIPYFLKALFMFILIYLIKYINILPIYRVILQVIIGIIIYGLLNIKYIKSFIK